MAQKNKFGSSSSGLRFLWIPGRKHHHHKGKFETTNKGHSYNSHGHKKNEVWSLGGSKAHEDIIKPEDIVETPATPNVSSILPATCVITVAATPESNGLKKTESNEELNGHVTLATSDNNHNDAILNDIGNAATLPACDKKNKINKKNPDLDSIEISDETDAIPYVNNSKIPPGDGTNMRNRRHLNGKSKQKGNKLDGKVKKENEKTVKCLYYTLMCCECNIS